MNIFNNMPVSPSNRKVKNNRDFAYEQIKRREEKVEQDKIANAEEAKKLEQQKALLEQLLQVLIQNSQYVENEKKELQQEKKNLENKQEALQNESESLKNEKSRFDDERRQQIIGFIIEGFFIATLVGLLVNQITDMITFAKNYFYENMDYSQVSATIWVIIVCVTILLFIFIHHMIDIMKK